MNNHQPVLLKECLEALLGPADGTYIDGTFGRGGHSRALLSLLNDDAHLIAIDKDLDAVSFGQKTFEDEPRLSIHHSSFAEMGDIAKKEQVYGKVDGILLDLGVSSPQLDDKERGFSFLKDGPLDMRMDKTQGESAKDWLNHAKVAEIQRVLKVYGEERFAKRIANAIVLARQEKEITRTKELADIVAKANPAWERHKHPATRSFQAIRIYVNRELEDLENFLANSLDILKEGGRLVIISFHSLEDRIVKQFMRRQSQGKKIPAEIPVTELEISKTLKIIAKAVKPSGLEIEENVRARSAVLRVGEKLL